MTPRRQFATVAWLFAIFVLCGGFAVQVQENEDLRWDPDWIRWKVNFCAFSLKRLPDGGAVYWAREELTALILEAGLSQLETVRQPDKAVGGHVGRREADNFFTGVEALVKGLHASSPHHLVMNHTCYTLSMRIEGRQYSQRFLDIGSRAEELLVSFLDFGLQRQLDSQGASLPGR